MGNQFTFNSRILSEILAKYPNTFVALCELINNSIQAQASEIRIQIDYTPGSEVATSAIKKLVVRDNGNGVPKSEFKWRILEVGTRSKENGKGIGRFAALQLAERVQIETVAYDPIEKAFFKSELPLDISGWQSQSVDQIKLNDTYKPIEGKQKPYYQVTIEGFYGEDIVSDEKHKRIHKSLLESEFEAALFAAYPEQVFKKSIKFVINGKTLKAEDYILGKIESTKTVFTTLDGEKHEFAYQFVHIKTIGDHRVFLRVSNNGLQTVAHTLDYEVEMPEPNQWFVLVDSPLFDSSADTFRNLQVYEIDPNAEHLVKGIKSHVDEFFSKRYEKYKTFIQSLRADTFYPYKTHKASSESRSALFNQLAYYIEEKHRLLKEDHKIRELVYALMDKALNSGDFEVLFESVIKLDKTLVGRFRELLNKVDLEEVIEFSETIASKQQFLDFLHKLVYGDIAKYVKERSQLHKIIEKRLWLFGENYNDTPKLFSDKNLANNLIALRDKLFNYELTEADENLFPVADEKARNITDLFFYNERITDNQKREIMVVELKAPKVRLSDKELTQARRYAMQIEKEGVFPKNHSYKVLLVGSEMSESAKAQCGQPGSQNPYLVYRSKEYSVEVWAIHWSDLIEQNRTKLSYLGTALNTKDRDVRDVFETEFKEIDLQKLDSILEPNQPVIPKKRKKAK